MPWLRLTLVCCLLGACQTSPRGRDPDHRRPNVLVLVADDLGWNDIGFHNAEIRSPHLDALCRSGVELDCHYVQPQCTPTRVALMTGRYPSRFGRHCTQASNAQALPLGTPTLASVLKAAGYATAMTGKWHLGSKPAWGPGHYGFDSSHGSLTGAVGMYDHRYRLKSPYRNTWHRDHHPLQEEGHVTDLCADEAIRWIEARRNATQPWLLYVPFHAVHIPLVERDSRWLQRNAHIAHPDRRLYAAAVSHLDAAVGRIVAALERSGQRERTCIVFTSDNGAQVHHSGNQYPPPDPRLRNFSSNAPLRGKKKDAFEGGFRVPAFVNWPRRLQPSKVRQVMHCVDWLPTLARLCGASLPALPEGLAYDGVDVWPQIRGAAAPRRRQIYTNWGGGRRLALRDGDLKILRNQRRGAFMLFDLAADPHESRDLASTRPQDLARLRRMLAAQRKRDAR